EISAPAGGHSDHDAGVALPAADLERARGAAIDRHGDHRRNSRARPDQARRTPGVIAGAPRTVLCTATAADWTVGDTAAARRGRAIPRWRVDASGECGGPAARRLQRSRSPS